MLAGETFGVPPVYLDGKTSVNQWMIAKFTNAFPRQRFALYSILLSIKHHEKFAVGKNVDISLMPH